MTFVDTHCHLYDEAFDSDREAAVEKALGAGVGLMLLPDIDSGATERLDELYRLYPQHFRRMAGLHPTSVGENLEQELEHVRARLAEGGCVAVGEIGMDLYWDKTYEEQQREALKRQMQWAWECNLPVALHIRKAYNEVFGLLRDLNRGTYRGVMQCFGGSVQEARRAVEMGFMLGIGGVVTYKNATMAEVVREISIDHLLLETDAPYLPPVPHRGQRNESAYIPLIAQKVADIKGLSLEAVAEQTTANAVRLFGL